MEFYVTVADRIRRGILQPEKLKDLRKFAKSEDMLVHTIPLKDGTTAKILSNALEYDCLITKDGKILTARGQCGTADEVISGICGLYEHIEKRNRARKGFETSTESFNTLCDYIKKFEKFMSDV